MAHADPAARRHHAEQLTSAGFQAIGLAADIGDPASIEALFEHVAEAHDGIDARLPDGFQPLFHFRVPDNPAT